jgi:hypothetical protein
MNIMGYCLYVGQQQERARVLAWLRLGIDPDSIYSTEYERLVQDIEEERHCE